MADLSTQFIGIKLKNPIIVSSSGLTNSVEKIEKLEASGAGAVVLKSLFEEQINYETNSLLKESDYPEAADYIKTYARDNSLDKYITLIEGAKKQTNIPIIASINCVTATDWFSYAKTIEKAGADALELNIHIVPNSKHLLGIDIEEKYTEIVENISSSIKIPVIVKIGYHFTNLLHTVNQIAHFGAKAVTLFNRFYEPDIDLDSMKITSASVFSSPTDIRHTLRWVGLISGMDPKIELSASTGVHSGESVAKLLLAGASTIQVCSVLYKNGIDTLKEILEFLNTWMDSKGYETIGEFRGKLNASHIKDPAIYERAQFMKYFSNME